MPRRCNFYNGIFPLLSRKIELTRALFTPKQARATSDSGMIICSTGNFLPAPLKRLEDGHLSWYESGIA